MRKTEGYSRTKPQKQAVILSLDSRRKSTAHRRKKYGQNGKKRDAAVGDAEGKQCGKQKGQQYRAKQSCAQAEQRTLEGSHRGRGRLFHKEFLPKIRIYSIHIREKKLSEHPQFTTKTGQEFRSLEFFGRELTGRENYSEMVSLD